MFRPVLVLLLLLFLSSSLLLLLLLVGFFRSYVTGHIKEEKEENSRKLSREKLTKIQFIVIIYLAGCDIEFRRNDGHYAKQITRYYDVSVGL